VYEFSFFFSNSFPNSIKSTVKKVKNGISYYSIKFIGKIQFLKNGNIQLTPFLNSAKNSFLEIKDNNGDFHPNGDLF
jgi:hypothetical protein